MSGSVDLMVMSQNDMRQLAATFGQQAEAATAIMNAVDRALGSTQWQGRRANHFREQWNGPFKQNLLALQQALNENATVITRELEAGMAAMDGGVPG